MSYADRTPIREGLLERVAPLIGEHKGTLVVLDYDIQLQTWQPPGAQAQMINSWCLVVLTLGALVGEENYLSYVWTFGQTPHVPNDRVLTEAVRQTFQRLHLMKQRQLQTAKPSGLN